MIFNSFQFIWLFPLIFIAYWIIDRLKIGGKRSKRILNCFLLLVSYGLYAQWSLPHTLILFFVTLCTYLFAILIEYKRAFGRKKYIIWCGALLTLLPLLVYKYFNFITAAGASALAWIGIDAAPPGLNWVVPLGLSFYSFQALGYLWDVYYKRFPAEHDFLDYMLFVAFFPQILCGPISRAGELLPQIKKGNVFNYDQATSGLRFLLWGMFLKVVLADRLGIYVDTIYASPADYSGSSCILAAIFYSFQIYGDFAGYSFMALGVARLLGYDIIKNFNRPYLATSVSLFWKRWNISLTRWLTTYIYIPQGGNRKGAIRTYWNIMLTFLVSGIWHGANWTFIFWGVLHGAAQCMEKMFGLNKECKKAYVAVPRILITFFIVTLAWIFFRMPSIEDGFAVIRHSFSLGMPYLDLLTISHALVALAVVIAVDLLAEYRNAAFHSFLRKHTAARWAGYVGLTMSIILLGVLDSGQFIYVSF